MLNHITIMGRLTRDPELRRTGSGVAVASFTLAVDRDFTSKGSEKETDFIDCVAWRQTGEFVSKYFAKGRMACVSGSLQIRKWKDKDGNERRSAEVIADSVYFADSKNVAENGNSRPTAKAQPAAPTAYATPTYATPAAAPAGNPAYPAGNPAAGNYPPIYGDDGQLPF